MRGMGSWEDETAGFFCPELFERKFNELKSCRPLPGIDYLVFPLDSKDWFRAFEVCGRRLLKAKFENWPPPGNMALWES